MNIIYLVIASVFLSLFTAFLAIGFTHILLTIKKQKHFEKITSWVSLSTLIDSLINVIKHGNKTLEDLPLAKNLVNTSIKMPQFLLIAALAAVVALNGAFLVSQNENGKDAAANTLMILVTGATAAFLSSKEKNTK